MLIIVQTDLRAKVCLTGFQDAVARQYTRSYCQVHAAKRVTGIQYKARGIPYQEQTWYSRFRQILETTFRYKMGTVFNCITTMPYLMRAHAYKDMVAKNKEPNVGLFDYPMLMAADILIQDADVVPVGADQKQHVEYARDTAEKFNRVFKKEIFKLPEPLIQSNVATVVGTDGRKMSKSYGNVISLFSSDDEIKKAVMSIPTDSKTVEEAKDPEECKVFALHKLFAGDKLPEIEKKYQEGGMGYKESKDILIENVISFIKPLREKREELAKDPDYVLNVLKEGGNNARARAKEKMNAVRACTGIITTK